jgi:hypothetical protein
VSLKTVTSLKSFWEALKQQQQQQQQGIYVDLIQINVSLLLKTCSTWKAVHNDNWGSWEVASLMRADNGMVK